MKKLTIAALILSLSVSSLSGCSFSRQNKPSFSTTEDQDFEKYMSETFKEDISSNTLNLHYTITDPKAYGIDDYKVTLGDFSKEEREKTKDELKDELKELKSFDKNKLSLEQQLDYDILSNYLETQIKLCDYELFADPLSPNNGTQSQLPILFAEYDFNSKQDVEDYLILLKDTKKYFKEIIEFEKEKAKAGLFMSDEQCNDVIEACESFIDKTETNYLLSTFENKLNKLDGLSSDEKNAYIKKNKKAFKKYIIPAYKELIKELTGLLGSGTNDAGLCNYNKGKNYYELLVYSDTGSSLSVKDMFKNIEKQRDNDLYQCSAIAAADSDIFTKCSKVDLGFKNNEEMIDQLQKALVSDFPQISDTQYTISYLDKSMSESMAPAFYITAPIDNYKQNRIYINSASDYDEIYYFTTLAHEGYPGHLYQTVMTYDEDIDDIRSLLDFGGYVEGWATYVEMQSYNYAGLEKNVASFLQHNQAATLSLYASSDIGVHYYGWDLNDLKDFWADYGISDEESINDIMNLVLAQPGDYLKYYVGYLEFMNLKEKAQEKYGKNFSLVSFHDTLLDIGPAPFDIIDKYYEYYYH